MGKSSQPDFLSTLVGGRAGRSQFWNFYAFVAIPAIGLYLAHLLGGSGSLEPFLHFCALLWAILFLVPLTAAMSRRFHDIGYTGWWVIIQFAVAVSILVGGIAFSNLGRPERDLNCFRTDGLAILLGEKASIEPPRLSPEERQACRANENEIAAFEDLLNIFERVSLGVVVLTHVTTLFFLTRPSLPGPNKYGPNPYEVPQ